MYEQSKNTGQGQNKKYCKHETATTTTGTITMTTNNTEMMMMIMAHSSQTRIVRRVDSQLLHARWRL